MDNLLDSYMKIKLRTNSEIQVVYYKDGCRYKSNITLLNVCGFLYIFGINEYGEYENINFFGKNTMIESIMVEGSNIPIYYNSYSNNNYIANGKLLFEMNNIMFDIEYDANKDFYKTYYDREKLIEKYIAKKTDFKYEDLFFFFI